MLNLQNLFHITAGDKAENGETSAAQRAQQVDQKEVFVEAVSSHPFVNKSHYNIIIDYDACVRDGKGGMIATLVKGALPKKVTEMASEVLRAAPARTSLRANIFGGEAPLSGIAGYYDYTGAPIEHKCRKTSFTCEHEDDWFKVFPLVNYVSEVYRAVCPEEWRRQDAAIPDVVRINSTPFSTLTLNQRFRTAKHTDSGDFDDGFGVLAILEGTYEGLHLGVPDFGVCFRMQAGDVLLFNTHHFHCNTELEGDTRLWDRLTCVFYYRAMLGEANAYAQYERRLREAIEEGTRNVRFEYIARKPNGVNLNRPAEVCAPLTTPFFLALALHTGDCNAAVNDSSANTKKGSNSVTAKKNNKKEKLVFAALQKLLSVPPTTAPNLLMTHVNSNDNDDEIDDSNAKRCLISPAAFFLDLFGDKRIDTNGIPHRSEGGGSGGGGVAAEGGNATATANELGGANKKKASPSNSKKKSASGAADEAAGEEAEEDTEDNSCEIISMLDTMSVKRSMGGGAGGIAGAPSSGGFSEAHLTQEIIDKQKNLLALNVLKAGIPDALYDLYAASRERWLKAVKKDWTASIVRDKHKLEFSWNNKGEVSKAFFELCDVATQVMLFLLGKDEAFPYEKSAFWLSFAAHLHDATITELAMPQTAMSMKKLNVKLKDYDFGGTRYFEDQSPEEQQRRILRQTMAVKARKGSGGGGEDTTMTSNWLDNDSFDYQEEDVIIDYGTLGIPKPYENPVLDKARAMRADDVYTALLATKKKNGDNDAEENAATNTKQQGSGADSASAARPKKRPTIEKEASSSSAVADDAEVFVPTVFVCGPSSSLSSVSLTKALSSSSPISRLATSYVAIVKAMRALVTMEVDKGEGEGEAAKKETEETEEAGTSKKSKKNKKKKAAVEASTHAVVTAAASATNTDSSSPASDAALAAKLQQDSAKHKRQMAKRRQREALRYLNSNAIQMLFQMVRAVASSNGSGDDNITINNGAAEEKGSLSLSGEEKGSKKRSKKDKQKAKAAGADEEVASTSISGSCVASAPISITATPIVIGAIDFDWLERWAAAKDAAMTAGVDTDPTSSTINVFDTFTVVENTSSSSSSSSDAPSLTSSSKKHKKNAPIDAAPSSIAVGGAEITFGSLLSFNANSIVVKTEEGEEDAASPKINAKKKAKRKHNNNNHDNNGVGSTNNGSSLLTPQQQQQEQVFDAIVTRSLFSHVADEDVVATMDALMTMRRRRGEGGDANGFNSTTTIVVVEPNLEDVSHSLLKPQVKEAWAGEDGNYGMGSHCDADGNGSCASASLLSPPLLLPASQVCLRFAEMLKRESGLFKYRNMTAKDSGDSISSSSLPILPYLRPVGQLSALLQKGGYCVRGQFVFKRSITNSVALIVSKDT